MATPSDHHAEIAFPPFDATTFGSQLFWFAIVFGALYLLISRAVAPRIAGILEDRRARIAGDLDDAAKKQAQAQAAAEAHEKSLAEARANAQKIGQEAHNKLAAEAALKQKAIETDLAARLAASEKQVADTKKAALANVESVANDAAAAIVEKLAGAKPSADAIAAAVKSALGR